MWNWLVEYSRYAFTKAARWYTATFSVIGFVGTFLGMLGIFYLLDVKEKPPLSVMQCILITCVILIALYIFLVVVAYVRVGVVSVLLRAKPDNGNYRGQMAEIDELRFRGLYIDKQIHEIENAKKSILLSIHSLSDENKKKQYKKFNVVLRAAKERGVDVKVLAPCGRERAIGAYQLSEIYGIEMRFANQLEIEDLRFICVDNERVVFSQQKVPNKGLSAKFSEVHGNEICKMLGKYFKKVWKDSATLDYERYLIKCTRDLFRSVEDINLEVAARNLNVPIKQLERAFEKQKNIAGRKH